MNSKRNVIDITHRLKSRNETNKSSLHDETHRSESAAGAKILNLSSHRRIVEQQERRKTKRTILSELLGAFVVIPQHGLQKILVHDISDQGMAFDVPKSIGQFRVGEELALRVYFSQKNYLSLKVKVAYVRGTSDTTVLRHGSNFLEGSCSPDALLHLVKFIETASRSLHTDSGDLVVSQKR